MFGSHDIHQQSYQFVLKFWTLLHQIFTKPPLLHESIFPTFISNNGVSEAPIFPFQQPYIQDGSLNLTLNLLAPFEQGTQTINYNWSVRQGI